MPKRFLFTTIVLFCTFNVSAITPAAGFRKYRVEATRRGIPATPAPDLLRAANGESVASYGAYVVLRVPERANDRFLKILTDAGYEAVEEPELLHTPARTVDTARTTGGALTHHGGRGLFVLQFASYPLPAWRAALADQQVVEIDTLPNRAVIVAASNDAFLRGREHAFLQFADRYDRRYKYILRSAQPEDVYEIQFADTPEAAEDIAGLAAMGIQAISDIRYLSSRNIRAFCTNAQLEQIIDLPFVVGVERYVPPSPSDGRQVHAIRGVGAPDSTNYISWLGTQGITPAELKSSNIIVDVTDMGLDTGCNGTTRHPDLSDNQAYWNIFHGEDTVGAGRGTHGTMVAGVIGGQGIATSPADTDSKGTYRYGLGVAPGVRVGATKIMNGSGYPTETTNIVAWAKAAVTAKCGGVSPCTTNNQSCAASIQNHSHNDYTDDSSGYGVYTMNSRLYDTAVRDANPDVPGDQPLAMTVSAGNYLQRTTSSSNRVIPPATAKNVLTMGALENVRDEVTSCTQELDPQTGGILANAGVRNQSAGFFRLAWTSQRTTVDFRYKPELVAPATVIFSTHSQYGPARLYCGSIAGSRLFTGASGTSFAAPYGAGAMALVKFQRRKYYFHDPTPAMLKAMLVAGSLPLTGYPDRHDGPEYNGTASNGRIDRWPGYEQGFGMLRLNTLFDRSVYHWWADQAIILNQSAPTWSRTFVINDGSKPTRIALAWTDVPGTAGVSPSIVNKLTLNALFPDCNNRYFGNAADAANNSVLHTCRTRPVTIGGPSDTVSVINLPAGRYATGTTFTIQVSGGILGTARRDAPGPNQDFALFAMNARPQ